MWTVIIRDCPVDEIAERASAAIEEWIDGAWVQDDAGEPVGPHEEVRRQCKAAVAAAQQLLDVVEKVKVTKAHVDLSGRATLDHDGEDFVNVLVQKAV